MAQWLVGDGLGGSCVASSGWVAHLAWHLRSVAACGWCVAHPTWHLRSVAGGGWLVGRAARPPSPASEERGRHIPRSSHPT